MLDVLPLKVRRPHISGNNRGAINLGPEDLSVEMGLRCLDQHPFPYWELLFIKLRFVHSSDVSRLSAVWRTLFSSRARDKQER